jgi:uncharacterized hydrophobic protein (TIGR00271 family)
MASVAAQDIDAMRDAVFFDGADVRRRLSRFWILLVLAAIIAAAGVIADSTATVIGAMIVAPLMVPIQGTMLAVVLADRRNLMRSLGLMIGGAAAAIVVGFVVAVPVLFDITSDNNAQVAARVTPRLIDLLAALATGVVGSVALARRDISDALPGVAIAISLVPPLTVVGITLEAGEYDQAAGAMLLFVTNVAAILVTGTVVMAIYGTYRWAVLGHSAESSVNRRRAVGMIVALMVVVGVPLTISSAKVVNDITEESAVNDVGSEWAHEAGWELVSVTSQDGRTVARFEGPLPAPDVEVLRASLQAEGIDVGQVRVELLPRETVDLGD